LSEKEEGLYSPLLPEAYGFAPMAGHRYRAWWNLYWLSDPSLDAADSGLYNPQALGDRMLSACRMALPQWVGKMRVEQLLLLPAADFVYIVKAGPYKHLAPYAVRGDRWLMDIEDRSVYQQDYALTPDRSPWAKPAARLNS